MADSSNPNDADLGGDARRLHNGPLQSMFAAVMILESGAQEATENAIRVLREGVRDLNEIIESVHRSEQRGNAGP